MQELLFLLTLSHNKVDFHCSLFDAKVKWLLFGQMSSFASLFPLHYTHGNEESSLAECTDFCTERGI